MTVPVDVCSSLCGPSHFNPRNYWVHPRGGRGATGCLTVAGDPSMQPVRARTTLSLRQPENRSSGERLGERSSETNQESSHPHAGVETMGSDLRILWISGGSWGRSQLRRLDDQGHRGKVGGDGALRGTGPSFMEGSRSETATTPLPGAGSTNGVGGGFAPLRGDTPYIVGRHIHLILDICENMMPTKIPGIISTETLQTPIANITIWLRATNPV